LRTLDPGGFWARSSGAASPGYPDEVRLHPVRPVLHNNRPRWRGLNADSNDFDGLPNRLSGHPNDFNGLPNRFNGHPNDFNGLPNRFNGHPNDFNAR
jgi:hypothetical protein